MTNIPLAVKRQSDHPDYLTCDTILGKQVEKVKDNLLTETRVTRLSYDSSTGEINGAVNGAVLRDLKTNKDILVAGS